MIREEDIVRGTMTPQGENKASVLGDSRGAVLMVVLVALVVTMFIGIVLMKSTNIESRIAANDIEGQRDFYACEAAGEIAKAKFDEIMSETVMDETTNTTIDVSTTVNGASGDDNVLDSRVTISFLKRANPPVSSGTSPSSSFANYYVIETTVNGKKIQTGVWKAFPKAE